MHTVRINASKHLVKTVAKSGVVTDYIKPTSSKSRYKPVAHSCNTHVFSDNLPIDETYANNLHKIR